MTINEVLKELKSYANDQTKKTFMNHGAVEPFWGVKVGDMKNIVKKVKKDHELALALYDTEISDAMYLAGLIADEEKMTSDQLEDWAAKARWYMHSEYTVAWIAAESKYGWELGLKWIESSDPMIQCTGWSTISSIVSIYDDSQLDIPILRSLLNRVNDEIHKADNRVRYVMNGYVISIGSYLEELTNAAKKIAVSIGRVHVEMGGTACKVPFAPDYIQKVIDKGNLGKKRKSARC